MRRRLAASAKEPESHAKCSRVLEHDLRVGETMAHSIAEMAPECACAILRMTSEAARSASSMGSSCSGGRCSLKAVAAAEYDLVLMECQMPEIDETLATRAIRNLD